METIPFGLEREPLKLDGTKVRISGLEITELSYTMVMEMNCESNDKLYMHH